MLNFSLLSCFFILFFSCEETKLNAYKSTNNLLEYSGRHEVLTETATALIGSAASVEFNAKGDSISLYIQSEINPRNYFVLAINDEYQKRYQIRGESINKITLKLPENKVNKIGIFKASEAFHGAIIIHKVEAEEILPLNENKIASIEFIGDSITCGALSDNSEIPCNEGDYIDQHNAYLSYAPRVARALNAKYVLSSVSGIGMYRNWNDENIEEAIMPQVYDHLYLNKDNPKTYNIDFRPDVVSICLGTNDMSDGDGKKERLPFNSEKFTNNYINFVENLYKRYPETKIALLSSPMIDGKKNDTLVKCLKQVQAYFKINKSKDIALFQFDKIYPNGCNHHPSISDNYVMADQLKPFFNTLLKK